MHRGDDDRLLVSGRIEGYETNVGAKIAGRVEYISVREGAQVKKGELLVRLSDADIQAQLRGAEARVKKAEAAKEQADEQLDVAQSAIAEAKLGETQAAEDAQGRIRQGEANVASAVANLEQARAQLSQAKADHSLAILRKERYQKLAQRGAVAQDDADEAATNEATAAATVEARGSAVQSAQKQLSATEGALTQARTNRFNPSIKNAQLVSANAQLRQAKAALSAAMHDIANANAEVDQIKANIEYLHILSPIDAIVTARPVEPGAVIAAGQNVLSIIDLNKVYLRAYIPDAKVGRVRVGQKANVFLDASPKTPLPSHVIEIDPVASFTPENIYFKEDRVKQVFGMKIAIDNPQGYAKPGMPADAEIIPE